MWAYNSLKSPPPHQNSCSNTSGPQSMAVWATANTAAPSVADSPHTAIFTILFPLPHSWPRSRGKAASRPECREYKNTEQGGGIKSVRSGDTERSQNAGGWTKAGSSCILLLGLKIKKGSRDVNKLGEETRRRRKQTKKQVFKKKKTTLLHDQVNFHFVASLLGTLSQMNADIPPWRLNWVVFLKTGIALNGSYWKCSS